MNEFLLAVVFYRAVPLYFAHDFFLPPFPRLDYIPARGFIAGPKYNPDTWKLSSPLFNLVSV